MATASAFTATLIPAHVAYLAGENISEKVALAHGTYSVLTDADMPDKLKWAWDGAGIIFVNHCVDGSKVYQYRPDVPTKKDLDGKVRKYIFAVGSATGPFVSPMQEQQDLIGKAKLNVIAEGTKGLLAVITMLEEAGELGSILILGVAGCNGGMKKGLHSPDFAAAIMNESEVSICFDGDVSTNYNVHLGASRLKMHLENRRSAKTTLMVLETGGTNGISDYLGSLGPVTPADKFGTFMNLIKNGRKKMPRQPKRPVMAKAVASAGGSKVFWDEEVIAEYRVDEDGAEETTTILLDAAIRPTAIHETFDDLQPNPVRSLSFDLELKKGGCTYQLPRVASSQLGSMREAIEQIPGAIGGTITMAPRMGEDIGEAIRAASGHAGAELPVKHRIKRSGLYTQTEEGVEVTRYVGGNLAIGPNNSTDELTGAIGFRKVHGMELEDPHMLTDEEVRAGWAAVLRLTDRLIVDPSPWIMGTGMMACAAAGVVGIGGGIIYGVPGSGKTELLKQILRMQNPTAEPGNFEGTANSTGGLGKGMHHAAVGVDDSRDRGEEGESDHKTERKALSALCRRALGGGGYSKSRMRFDKLTGEVEDAAQDLASPTFIISIEASVMPTGKGSESDNERMFGIGVTHASTYRDGGFREADDLAGSGTMHRAWVSYLRFITREVEAAGSRAAYDVKVKDAIEETMEALKLLKPQIAIPRRYRIVANALFGYQQMLRAAMADGAIDAAELAERYITARNLLAESYVQYAKHFLSGGENAEDSVIDKMTSAVLSGKYAIAHPEAELKGGVKRLGWFNTLADGTDVVLVLPDVAMEVTGYKRQALNVALKDHLVLGQGGYTRRARTSGSATTPAYALLRSAWGGEDPTMEEMMEGAG